MRFDVPEIAPAVGQTQQPESYGTWTPATSVSIANSNGQVSPCLNAAPAGFAYHIKWIGLWAATTTYSATATLDLTDNSTGYTIVRSYAQANGIQLNLMCDMFLNGGFQLHNSVGAVATLTIVYATEPIV